MTRAEFTRVVAYLAAGTGKALPADSLEVYFDCLGDLPFELMMLAAKRVVLEHPWHTFPSIAELRQAASESARGQVAELSPAEAWSKAWRAIGDTDPEVEGSFARAVEGLPPIVVEAIRAYGVQSMCYGKEPVGVVRGQFLKIYEQLAARDKRLSLYPAPLKKAVEGVAKPLPGKVLAALDGIGGES